MGKGDKKSRRGKISQGSYGKKRARKKKSVAAIPVKVLDKGEKTSPVEVVSKKLPEQKSKSQNAEIEGEKEAKPKATRKKKTEE